jgi:tripartite-type tricarboxylate transporter receptor subunit TctC
MSDKPAALYPNVPTLQAAVNSQWTLGTWRGLAAPRNLPADVQTKLSVALKKIYDGKAFQDFMASRGFGVSYADAKTFEQFMQRADSDMGATMKSVGLVK